MFKPNTICRHRDGRKIILGRVSLVYPGKVIWGKRRYWDIETGVYGSNNSESMDKLVGLYYEN